MSSNRTTCWEWLARWSAAALITAGLIQLFNLLLHTLPMVTEFSAPELVRDVTLAVAGIVALLGLLGFVPRLREVVPRVARAGAVVAVLGVVGQLAVALGEPLIGGDTPPAWFMPLFLLHWIVVPLSFLVFGTASLRTRAPSRRVGAVLVVVFVSFLFFHHLIPLHVEGLLAQLPSLVIGGGLIAAGYLHHTESPPSGRADPASDPAAR